MIRIAAIVVALGLCLPPGSGAANEIQLPSSARLVSTRTIPFDSYDLPTGPVDGAAVPARRFEGQVEKQTWRLDGSDFTTLQLLAPLREQLADLGFELIFECEATDCGGFDFRFGTYVVPAPDMYVDIRKFRFVSARRGDGDAMSILVSRSRDAGFIQVILVTQTGSPPITITKGATSAAPVVADTGDGGAGDIATSLLEQGHVILDGLKFDAGAGDLKPGSYEVLRELAKFLSANPDYLVAVVGHTDNVGSLQANIALSHRRAEQVRDRLIEDYGVAQDRLEAGGMGYLSPVASNLTPEGREANRRVEAVLLTR